MLIYSTFNSTILLVRPENCLAHSSFSTTPSCPNARSSLVDRVTTPQVLLSGIRPPTSVIAAYVLWKAGLSTENSIPQSDAVSALCCDFRLFRPVVLNLLTLVSVFVLPIHVSFH